MFILTHAAMGAALYRYTLSETGLDVDRRRFVFGNVLPDVHPKWLALSHRFEEVSGQMDGLYLEIRQLMMDGQSPSEALGVLCHFLSDAFCSYHMEESLWRGSRLAHLLFEIRLHWMFFRLRQEDVRTVGGRRIRPGMTLEEIHRGLKAEFLRRGSRMSDNLRYAMMFCVLTIQMLEEDVRGVEHFQVA